MWGFERVNAGSNKGAYIHKYFIRGQPELCSMMRRIKIKGGTASKKQPNTSFRDNYATPNAVTSTSISMISSQVPNDDVEGRMGLSLTGISMPQLQSVSRDNNASSSLTQKHNHEFDLEIPAVLHDGNYAVFEGRVFFFVEDCNSSECNSGARRSSLGMAFKSTSPPSMQSPTPNDRRQEQRRVSFNELDIPLNINAFDEQDFPTESLV
jgi:hypothetical protein